MKNYSLKHVCRLVIILLGVFVFGVTNAHASGAAYSRARAYLRSDAPSGSGKVYVGQAATSSPNYQTSSSSEKQGEKTTTTYHFYAQASAGYKFTGWYSKNANDEYVAAANSTVSGTTYRYTDTHYVVNVTSGANPQGTDNSYTDKDLYAGFIKVIQLSFIRPEDGSYTIMHNGAAVADYASFTVDGKVVLTATPDAGYKLRGWYTTTDGGVTKNYFAFAEEIEPSLTSNVTIGAEFVLDDGKADFWVKGTTTTYNDLNTANTAAAATSAKTIVLVNSGTIPAGTYTISSGVTLLIPYSSDYSKTDQPNIVHVTGINSAPALSMYKKLSLASGAVINCSGKICVGGQMMSINGGNPTSVVRGRAGVLDLSRGGLINLNSGSTLYAWGFVQGQDINQGNNTSGMGTIDAKSGSTVWEVFQCGEWRGGTASSTIYNNRSSWKFFPFQSYTVQNIEAPITYRAGATGKCKWTIFGDGKVYTVDFTLIGTSNALFNMSSGATLNKRYDPTTDRVCYELNGTNAVNALSLSALGQTINSSEYNLPIPANMQITVIGGTTTISNRMVMHAGAAVDIRPGATMSINTNVYIFDQEDWDTYCMYAYYYRSYASLTAHYNRGSGTSKATLEDAKIIVDGTLTLGGNGRIYSTTHGANIFGNNGGRITFNALPTKTTIVMCKQLKDNVNVNVSSANMHNIDGSYTKSIASTTFHNVNGRWLAAADKDPKANHTYRFTYIKSGDVYGTGGTDATVNTLYRSEWIDVKADVCDDWWQGLNNSYFYNFTLNNAWHQYENTSTVIGEGDEAATIYSGTDNNLYAKTNCDWELYGGADANCLQTIGGVKKAFINGSFVALTKNTEDEAFHNSANASQYFICFKDLCEWYPATKVAGANKAYAVTATGQKYIWYNSAWMAATQESPYFYTRSVSGEKTYYEYVGSEWTEANVVAESTRNGVTTRYFNLQDAFTDANANTKPGENTTIKIMKSVTISSALTFTADPTKGGTCTIDLNGFTLSGSINNMITVNGDKAVLVVLDQSPEETGKITISYSANNTRRRAVYVQNGRLMLNSGTIEATNSQAQVDAIYVNANELCDINGGQVKATASSGAYGIHTGANARATIKGGTITATSPASRGVYSEGGEIRMSAGTVNATTTGNDAIGLATTAAATSTITLSGGTVTATAASAAIGVQVGASTNTNGTATISGGTITATTTGATAEAVRSYATFTISGGSLTATAGAASAYGVNVQKGTTTINAGATVSATATTQSYSLNNSATLTVNGGTFRSTTSSATLAYGLYATAGTATVNNGDFTVTSKTTDAYGLFVPTAGTPKCYINGGKFMVKTNNGSTAGTINNTGASLANFALAGGYYNVAPNGTTNIAAGKEVKNLDAVVEASLISAGYTKKIAGTEYTVTWKNHAGAVLKTEKVESGKVPVWTGGEVNVSDAGATREHNGWSTESWNRGTSYVFPAALPAIGASDVTYFAHYSTIYAEVITGGTTTRYNDVYTAWNAAMAKTQATIRILSNLGTEASIENLKQLVFNPTNANSIITFDLNGYSWTMGNHATASENKDVLLKVSPTQANCKLIIADNSASGNGYLMNSWAKDGELLCAYVQKGELVLQNGGLKAKNTNAEKYSVCVKTANGAKFTMTGGMVYATDAYTPRGVQTDAGGTTNIVGGTVEVLSTKSEAYAVLAYGTTNIGGDAVIRATGTTGSAYATYSNGSGVLTIDGGTYIVNAATKANCLYATSGGKIVVDGNPTMTATATGNEAYGAYANGTNSEVTVNSGTFTLASVSSTMGARALSSGTATINGGTFTLNGSSNWTFGAFAQTGTININGGTFTISQPDGWNVEGIRIYPGGTCNVSGGTFSVNENGGNGANAIHAYGGTTSITGNPVFNSYYGINAGDGTVQDGDLTAVITVDGGTFNNQSFSLQSKTTSSGTQSITGDITVWDGKFKSLKGWQNISSATSSTYLKIRGGYFSNNTKLDECIVSPSTKETLANTDPMYVDPNNYRYRVNTKYNVTWSVNGVNTVQQYSRNETPSYGSTPTIDDGNYYVFTGWSPEIAPVTTDVTYTAQFTKYEAEVYEGESATPVRFELFTDAWDAAQNLPVAKVKLISNVSLSTQVILNPEEAAGSKPLTLDLNNHTLQYTGAEDRFMVVSKTGCKLIITDSSLAQGGKIKVDVNRAEHIIGVASHFGDLELQGGEIYVRNSNASAEAWGAYPCKETNFTMTGGTISTYARANARGVYTEWGSTPTVTISGGSVLASTEYDNSGTPAWGNNAYGVQARKGGKITVSGTASITAHANQDAYAAYASGNGGIYGEITIKGGTVTAIVETKRVFGAYADIEGKINIEGGAVDGHSNVAVVTSMWNVEGAHCAGGAILNISGGEITSSNGASPIGVSLRGGTTTITGGKISSKVALHAVDYADATQTATVNVFGGTFIGTAEAVRVDGMIRDGSIKNNANVTINGGYFYSEGSRIVLLNNAAGAEPSTLVLNGGKYVEKSGTTYKDQITARKGATTKITDINETVDGKTYKYQLSTQFNITWQGGNSYSKVEPIYCGETPSNNELDGKAFIRNDSAFYFTGWSPTPSPVIGETTYQAVGDYYEAEVKIGSGAWTRYADFLEAWDVVQTNANCTIRLLSNFTLTDKIIYKPTVANARTTFDLNNFTLTAGGTETSFIDFNKADAILTITDNSSAKGGKISMTRTTTSSTYAVFVYNGELKMAGGKIYIQNNQDKVNNSSWWPAIAIYVSNGTNAKLTMTGGTVESQAAYLAYPLYNYGTTNISGGTVRANATGAGSACGITAVAGTATVSGGTFNITSSVGAYGAMATATISNSGVSANGTLNITGGTFNISAATSNVVALQANATGKEIGGTIYKAHGITNVSGGTFNVSCPSATATQVFAAQCNGWRLFDNALPHTMRAEERSEINISGGTFDVDTRNNGEWLDNGANIDLLRCWGTLNVSGGNFTIHQYKNPNAITVYRGKATVSGNPVFNVYSHTANANGVVAGAWTHESYCDKDAANNLAEAEINGGTFKVITEGQNTGGILANAQISTETRDGETITAHAGYAMNAKITVNGGTFLTICPDLSSHYPIVFSSADDKVGTYGTAKSEVYVNGGRFKSRKGTEEVNSSTGAVNAHTTGKVWLTGGYYETNGQLNTRKADTCVVTTLTSAEMDPEYANGYRYKIEPHYVAKVSKAGASDRFFCVMKDAFDYAKTQDKSTITLLRTVDDYEGPTLYYNPSTAMSCTLDLNGFTFKGQATSGEPDRLLIVSKGGCTFTIKDSSAGKTGKFSHEKSGATFAAIVYHGTLVLESGTVHCKNTSGNAQALRSTDPDAIIQMTGGKAHAEASGIATAYGLNAYNKATISGGEILAEASEQARGVNAQNTNADVLINGAVTINANADKYAYGIYADGTSAKITVEAGTINSENANANGASITAYAISGGTIEINGGTFTATRSVSGNSNVQTVRTANNATMIINDGTFNGSNYQAVNIRGGETTINGGTFNAAVGIRAMDWADAATITGKLTVKGGTFTTTGTTIYVSSKANDSRNAHSEVTINGGKFKSTGSNIVQMDATPAGADPSTLIIAGGYFNEKSGTTFKDQIAPFIADTSRINTLDPLYEGTYKYEVAPHYVASVTDGAVVTNYTTLKAALDYAKTRNNSVVTLLDDCDFETNEQYGYSLCPSGKTMTLDLNNHTVNATSTDYDRVFGLSGQLTITDHSGSKNGKLSLTKDYSSTFIGIVLNAEAKLILEEGTVYVENERASRGAEAINIWGTTGIFTQTGGLVHVKASGTAKAFQHRGTINIEGGEVRVVSTAGRAIGDSPAAEDPSTDKIGRSNISGTAHFNITGQTDAYGVYNEFASNVSITGGTFDVTANTNNAYGIRVFTNAATITVNGPLTINTTSTTAMAYSIHAAVGTVTLDGAIACTTTGATHARTIQSSGTATITVNNGTYKSVVTGSEQTDSYVIIPEGTSAMIVNGGKFHSNKNNIAWANTGAGATLTINGGYFNESSGTAHKTQITNYKGEGKVIMNLDTDDAEYAAGYRYVVTADPVAKVKVGSAVSYYTALPTAFNYAKTKNNAEITLLKDVVSTSAITWNPSSAISNTFDLNGKSLSSTTMSTLLNINGAGATFIIKDTPGNGSISSSNAGNWSPCIQVTNGKLMLQSGTISRAATSDVAIGVQASTTTDATPEFEMTGGKIQTSGITHAYAIITKGSVNVKTSISGGEVSATATGTYAFALTAASGGQITVKGTNNPKISATGATTTLVARIENKDDGSAIAIEGGLFKASAGTSPFNTGSISISGGYFNEYGSTTTYKTQIESRCVAPKHAIALTAAEQAALGAGGTDYKYKIVDAYTLTWTTDGDALTGSYTSGMTEVGVTITAPNTPTKTGYTFAAWTPAVAATMPAANTTYTATWESAETGFWLDIVDWTASTLTINANGWTASGWPYTINDVVYYKDEATATAAGSSNYRAADRTLTIPYSGAAGTDLVIKLQDKDENIISQHSYKIPFIGTTAGAGTEDTVYVNEGTLTISTNTALGGLYVRPEASVTITGGTLTVGKLVLRTLPWQAAAISGSFTATETWYTRIAPNKRTITGPYAPITYESASYYQFALPLSTTVALKDIKVSHGANTPYGSTWLLKYYNEESRAANGAGSDNWVALGENETVQGGVGYEMFSNSNYYREFYFPVGAVNSASLGKTTDVAYDLGAAGEKHAGWNIVASPLMSVYDNTDANPETGLKVSWLMTDGSYDQGVPEYIYPAIPFSYQAGKSGTVSFAGSSLAALAPRRAVAAEDEPERIQWIHLDVKDEDGVGDHTSVLSHPTRYEDSYKTGIDVAKQSFEASRALIYSSHVYGEMAFAGVADSLLERGVALTLYSPSEQKLTISMRENNWLDRLAFVWLIDKETGARTDLLMNDYHFKATEGITTGRFYIEGQFFAPQVATDINPIQSDDAQGITIRKVLINDKMYIRVNGQMFDATGKLVTNK